MTDAAWRADLERVLSWTEADERFFERVSARLPADAKRTLAAVIETRGDARALAEHLGPVLFAKARARVPIPERVREPAAQAWKKVEAPLRQAWSPPAGASAEEIAQLFLERYGATLEGLTENAARAAAAAKSLAGALGLVSRSAKIAEAAEQLRAQAEELQAAATSCAHPEGSSWMQHAGELVHEGISTVESARSLRAHAGELSGKCEQLAATLRSWADAPPPERAATAESMAHRMRAAADAAASMHEEFLGALLGAGE